MGLLSKIKSALGLGGQALQCPVRIPGGHKNFVNGPAAFQGFLNGVAAFQLPFHLFYRGAVGEPVRPAGKIRRFAFTRAGELCYNKTYADRPAGARPPVRISKQRGRGPVWI